MGGTPPPFAENSAKIINLIFEPFPKVLDLSSYFYFQIMSTPAEEDNDDVDDEGTFPEHSVNKVLVNGGGLSRRGRPRWRR